jgi:Tol biopolymer transport system component
MVINTTENNMPHLTDIAKEGGMKVHSWATEKLGVIRIASEFRILFISILFLTLTILSCNGGSNGDDTNQISSSLNITTVVFMADKDEKGTVELYASVDNGTKTIKLSGNLVAGGDVVDFQISPDGVFVAYVADQDSDQKFELYVVPVDKGPSDTVIKVSGLAMAGNGIQELDLLPGEYAFAWAPDSSRVAYLADQRLAGVVELFSNLPDGSSNIRLSLLAADRDVKEFAWAPNSTLIAYLANQDSVNSIDLYTTLPNEGISQRISSGLDPGQMVTAFKWSPDSLRIAFVGDRSLTGFFRLFTTSPNNNFNVLVSGGLDQTSDVRAIKWSPDSLRIAYIVELVGNVFELFITLRDVQPSTLISIDLPDEDEKNFGWSPDSSLIAYIADQNTGGLFELFTDDPTGLSNAKVSGILVSGGDVVVFLWAPTAQLIAYLADQDTNDIFELYTTDPPLPVDIKKISGDRMAGFGVEDDFAWLPDSSLVGYRADQNTVNTIELFTSDTEGVKNDKVSGTLVNGGSVSEFKRDTTGSAIAYLADQDTFGIRELYASLPDGADNTKLSGDLVAGGSVLRFDWVP